MLVRSSLKLLVSISSIIIVVVFSATVLFAVDTIQ